VSAVLVPTGDESGGYTQTTTLDGTQYVLSFAYSQRSDCWYLSLSTPDGELIAAGIKLVCNWDLLWKCVSPLRPPGKLYVLSNTTDTSTPGLEDLLPSARCQLLYSPAADVAAAAAAASSS